MSSKYILRQEEIVYDKFTIDVPKSSSISKYTETFKRNRYRRLETKNPT